MLDRMIVFRYRQRKVLSICPQSLAGIVAKRMYEDRCGRRGNRTADCQCQSRNFAVRFHDPKAGNILMAVGSVGLVSLSSMYGHLDHTDEAANLEGAVNRNQVRIVLAR